MVANADGLTRLEDVITGVFTSLRRVVPTQPTSDEPAAIVTARPQVAELEARWATIRDIVDQRRRSELLAIVNDATLVPAERVRRRDQVLADMATTVDGALDDIERIGATLRDAMTRVGQPPRGAVDAASEARLTNLKADAKMTLDAIRGEADIAARLMQFLREAIAAGDYLAVWLFGTAPWPRLYLEARGAPERAAIWDIEAGRVLDAASPTSNAAAARAVLTSLDGATGLLALVLAVRKWARYTFEQTTRTFTVTGA